MASEHRPEVRTGSRGFAQPLTGHKRVSTAHSVITSRSESGLPHDVGVGDALLTNLSLVTNVEPRAVI